MAFSRNDRKDSQPAPEAAQDADPQGQEAVDEETDQGYRGVKVDPLPNSAYSLESGPDAPTVGPTGRLPQVDVADGG